MSSAESGVKVIERNFVGEVGYREPKRNSRVVLLSKQIISAKTDIEYVPRRDAARIMVIVLSARRRDAHAFGSKVGFIALCRVEPVFGSSNIVPTEETDRSLFRSRQT